MRLAVTFGDLAQLAANDNCTAGIMTSCVTVPVGHSGVRYLIKVDGAAGAAGAVAISFVLVSAPTLPHCPVQDSCIGAPLPLLPKYGSSGKHHAAAALDCQALPFAPLFVSIPCCAFL